MITAYLFVMGLVWGSFLNVVIYRIAHGESPIKGRSVCPNCKKTISWKYNIPLLSFLYLKGRCVNCHKKISWQYPIVEMGTGVLFIWWFVIGRSFFLLADQPWSFIQPLFWLVIGMLFVTIFMADLLFGIIPDSVNLAIFCLSLTYRLSLVATGNMQFNDFLRAIAAGVILTLFFGFLWWITKGRGFGLGDVKLAPALGLLLGWPKTLIAVFSAFVLGSLIGVMLLVVGKKRFGQTLPFGPFLVIGSVVALLWGGRLWGWYAGLL